MVAWRRLTTSAWQSYESALRRRPMATQVATSTALWTLGDVLAQRLDKSASRKEAAAAVAGISSSGRGGKASSSSSSSSSTTTTEKRKKNNESAGGLDLGHLAASALYGAAVVGPLGHAWYRWLDAFVSSRLARGSARFVASKVLLDEVVFGPVHVAGFFATVVVVAERGGTREISAKVKRDFASTYAAELAFWPAFQAVNFWRVPVRHQLLAVNLACLLDATFLCWASAHDDWVGAAKKGLAKFTGSDSSDSSSSKSDKRTRGDSKSARPKAA